MKFDHRACEALLIVEPLKLAQTISNLYLALEHDLEIILFSIRLTCLLRTLRRLHRSLIDYCDREEILHFSAKTGQGVPEILDAIIERIPRLRDPDGPLQALIFDVL